MAYEKRLCLIKQLKRGFSADGSPLTGAVYAERLGEELTLTPRIAGLSPLKEGRYVLAADIGGRRFCLEMKGNSPLVLPEAPSLAEGFAVLLCHVRTEPEAIAFGHCGSAVSDPAALIGAISSPSSAPKAETIARPPFREYDDEAIAQSDYYGGSELHEDEAPSPADPPKEEGACPCADGPAVHPFRTAGRDLTYYHKISARLKEAFSHYPKDERLRGAIPHSEWVDTGSALLGVVYEEGFPRYLCVALGEEPPEEAKEASLFVPFSPYSDEEGMFVVFQDADTGEYVKTSLA